MAIITVSREYGSGGRKVSAKVAEALGYFLLDKDLIRGVALEANVPVSEVEGFDEQPEHPIARAVRKLLTPIHPGVVTGFEGDLWGTMVGVPGLGEEGALPENLDEDAYVGLTQKVMLHIANRGNVVITGRGSQALFSDRTDVLHVRIVSNEVFKIQYLIEEEGLLREDAIKLIRKVDDQRRRYIKRHFGIMWDRPEYYHTIINTEKTGIDGASHLIAEAGRRLPMKTG